MWQRGGRWNLASVQRQVHQLEAGDCSDIIRLYGAVVEKGGFGEDAMKAKEKQRVGGRLVWGPQARVRGTPVTPPLQARPWLDSVTAAAISHGIVLKQAADGPHPSLVLKLDRAFGLPVGADISGTTADSIYFIREFDGALDPLYQLLPLAALVYAYHHALLEVAATLTLCGVIQYSIGCYTSLMPRASRHPAADNVRSTLEYWDNRVDNKRLLIYYSAPATIAGCFQFEGNDLPAYRQLAAVGIPLWNRFGSFDPWPTERNIFALLQDNGLGGRALAAMRQSLGT